eukprot:28923-Alexandrium_andersonii.AAC.1
MAEQFAINVLRMFAGTLLEASRLRADPLQRARAAAAKLRTKGPTTDLSHLQFEPLQRAGTTL